MAGHRDHRADLLLVALAIGGGAACGKTDPGTGSHTLFADVEVEGKPDSTEITVGLQLNGAQVLGANVVITDLNQNRVVTLEGQGRGNKGYRGQLSGYAQLLRIQVTSGSDRLEAQLDGPSPHTISRPPSNAIVRRGDGMVLTVEWQSEHAAQHTRILPDGAPALEFNGDPGSADIPLGPLKTGDQKLQIERSTQVELSGGVQGSIMKTRYTVDNRFTIEG